MNSRHWQYNIIRVVLFARYCALGRSLQFPIDNSIAIDRSFTRHPMLKERALACDKAIEFTGGQTAKQCPGQLRHTDYHVPKTGKHYVFLTNHFKLAAQTIAAIYQTRWQVELFFKWIKQNLNIKSFIGNSKNARYDANLNCLVFLLMLAFIKFQSKLEKGLQQTLRLLHLNQFDKRDEMDLLGWQPPLIPPSRPKQIVLF